MCVGVWLYRNLMKLRERGKSCYFWVVSIAVSSIHIWVSLFYIMVLELAGRGRIGMYFGVQEYT